MIRLNCVSIRQGQFQLSGIELSIPEQTYCTLMGPTGCGKTTLVEAICGLRPIQSGRIEIGQTDMTTTEPAERGIGYVPQDGVLFPAMRIDRQITFGLEVRGYDRKKRTERLHELAELLGLKHLLGRYSDKLSGGEKQRVALARALAFRPRLLCLDEPLTALDAATKADMIQLLREVHQREPVTVLHVTHDADEAKQLAEVRLEMSLTGQVSQVTGLDRPATLPDSVTD